jgi:copper chaperone CopZ
VSGALQKLPGVTSFDVKQGANDFAVTYDSTKLKPADIVTALVAAGEKGAKVKA